MRRRRVAMDVGQRLLNDTEEHLLYSEGQLLRLRVRPKLDRKLRAISVAVDVLADGRVQPSGLENRGMHQIADRAELLQRFVDRTLDLVPQFLRIQPSSGPGSKIHHIETRGDKMLCSRVVQFLRDFLALFLL